VSLALTVRQPAAPAIAQGVRTTETTFAPSVFCVVIERGRATLPCGQRATSPTIVATTATTEASTMRLTVSDRLNLERLPVTTDGRTGRDTASAHATVS
jgi:hypothetical protein